MKAFVAGLFLVASATASPWGTWSSTSSASSSPSASPSGSTQQVFFGRFISTPSPDQLSINTGAVLVSSSDGRGTIQNAVWNVTDAATALSSLGVASNVPVIYAADDGFFFPGFIGERDALLAVDARIFL